MVFPLHQMKALTMKASNISPEPELMPVMVRPRSPVPPMSGSSPIPTTHAMRNEYEMIRNFLP